MDFFLAMEPGEAKDFLRWLLERQTEDELWQRWIAGYQQTMSFEDFKSDLRRAKSAKKDKQEILDDVNSIIAMISGMRGGDSDGSI